MAIIMPEGGVVPVDEPAQLPCSNPPECEQFDLQMEASLKWNQWEYTCWSKNPQTPGTVIHISGYEAKWYRAWAQTNRPPLAHGPPEYELETGNVITVIRRPVTA